MSRARRGTILIVDDLEQIRVMLSRQLTLQGHTVLAAADGVEALHLVRRHGRRLGLVLSDVVMPAMNGTELAAVLSAEFPELPIVLMSGYAAAGLTRVGFHEAVIPVLRKPFEEYQLREIVQAALGLRARRGGRTAAAAGS